MLVIMMEGKILRLFILKDSAEENIFQNKEIFQSFKLVHFTKKSFSCNEVFQKSCDVGDSGGKSNSSSIHAKRFS
jgi:hypothetical protein